MARTKLNEKKPLETRDFYANDTPTVLNNPGFRIGFNILSALLLGINFRDITSSYFTSVLMFAIPMLADLYRFKREDTFRKVVFIAEATLLFSSAAICLLGQSGILYIDKINNVPYIMVADTYAFFPGFHFPARVLLVFCIFSLLFTVIDWCAARTRAEAVIIAGNQA